ncbi:RNA polymerase, sigma-24 subunit, ECF subfamily domain protein [Exiguobacterium sp. S17]|nr:RNA polymerase, sigma-24 subunit, ECF subfamily domain protein [Exiguobacterium sp. S17]
MSLITDHELYERIQQKDALALELLYDRYERILYAVTLRLTTRPDLAEAALSNVFTELWHSHVPFDLSTRTVRSHLLASAEQSALRSCRSKRLK